MTIRTVFYAWQAQRPGRCNRNLIEEALERALRELAQDQEEPVEFALDQDARGVSSAAEISVTILRRIDDCSIFVADVTPVGSLINGKATPNPNVLFELGYAWHKLGESRVILVLNQAFGAPEDLPFDLLKRSLVIYRRDPDASDGPSSVRSALVSRFRSLISAMASDDLRSLRESGLNATDIALFEAVYAKMLEAETGHINYEVVLHLGNSLGLDEEGVIDATQMLLGLGLWEAPSTMSPTRFSSVDETTPGMEQYCKAFLSDYQALTTDIQRHIVDGVESRGEVNSDELASAVGRPEMLIMHILTVLREDNYISIERERRSAFVFEVKPKLKRLLGR
jgi:hypothetical protein